MLAPLRGARRICEDAEQLAKVERVRGECPELELVVLDGRVRARRRRARRAARAGTADAPRGLVERRLAGVAPGDPATIVYTSGTTGPPKGCVTTHENLLTTAAAYERDLELGADLSMYLYLPLAHSLARIAQAVALQRRRDARLLGRRSQADRRRARGGRPDALPVGAARVREDPHRRAGRHRRAGAGCTARCSRGRSRTGAGGAAMSREGRRPRAARPRPPRARRPARALQGPRRLRRPAAARDDRRRADRARGARVLRRLRRADPRGLRHDRVVRRRDAQHAARRRGSAPSGGRSRAPRSRSPPTARC